MAVSEPVRLHLVRHGQSTWNALGRIQGQRDPVPLSCLGHTQAAQVAQHLAQEPVDLLVTSDLLRAMQTADAISDATARLPRRDRRLREQSYGRFEGHLSSEIAQLNHDWTDRGLRVGGGESFEDIRDRVGSAVEEIFAEARERDLRCLVLVTHGDTIRATLDWFGAAMPGAAPHWVPPNGSITTAQIIGRRVLDLELVVPVEVTFPSSPQPARVIRTGSPKTLGGRTPARPNRGSLAERAILDVGVAPSALRPGGDRGDAACRSGRR